MRLLLERRTQVATWWFHLWMVRQLRLIIPKGRTAAIPAQSMLHFWTFIGAAAVFWSASGADNLRQSFASAAIRRFIAHKGSRTYAFWRVLHVLDSERCRLYLLAVVETGQELLCRLIRLVLRDTLHDCRSLTDTHRGHLLFLVHIKFEDLCYLFCLSLK